MKRKMKRLLYYLFFCISICFSSAAYAQRSDDVETSYDSLVIIAFKEPFEAEIPISRYAFLLAMQSGEDRMDTTIVCKYDIANFEYLFNSCPKLSYCFPTSNEIILDLDYKKEESFILSPRNDQGDNRMLIIMCRNSSKKFLWFTTSGFYIDSGYYSYSNDLIQFMKKWTKCLD